MFDRPGETIKSFSLITFVIAIIASFILAITTKNAGGSFLLTLLIGIGASGIGAVFLYAFGVVVTAVEEINYKVSECIKLLEKMQKPTIPDSVATSANTPKSNTTTQRAYKVPVNTQKSSNDITIRCPNCGAANSMEADHCKSCGKAFEW